MVVRFKAWANFCYLKNEASYKSGQNWPKNNHLATKDLNWRKKREEREGSGKGTSINDVTALGWRGIKDFVTISTKKRDDGGRGCQIISNIAWRHLWTTSKILKRKKSNFALNGFSFDRVRKRGRTTATPSSSTSRASTTSSSRKDRKDSRSHSSTTWYCTQSYCLRVWYSFIFDSFGTSQAVYRNLWYIKSPLWKEICLFLG